MSDEKGMVMPIDHKRELSKKGFRVGIHAIGPAVDKRL